MSIQPEKYVFISHSIKDVEIAGKVCNFLEGKGIKCWIAPRDIKVGTDWAETIMKAILGCTSVVFLYSEWVNDSAQIRREIEHAVAAQKSILTLKLDDSKPSLAIQYYITTYQWLPNRNSLESSLEEIVACLDFTPNTDDCHNEDDRSYDAHNIDNMHRYQGSQLDSQQHSSNAESNNKDSKKLAILFIVVGLIGMFLIYVTCTSVRSFPPMADAPYSMPDSCRSSIADNTCLVIVDTTFDEYEQYYTQLGYTAIQMSVLPELPELLKYDLLVIFEPVSEGDASTLYAYIRSGGGLLLHSGQPYHLNMPDWLGMEQYSNQYGEDFYFEAYTDHPLGIGSIEAGDRFARYDTFCDGAAVLCDPTTATIDAVFSNDSDVRAACIRNQVGSGRVAWTTATPSPYAREDEGGYSTEAYQVYMEELYKWLSQ